MPAFGSRRRLRRPAGLPDGQADAPRRGRWPSTGWPPPPAARPGCSCRSTSAFRSDAEQAVLFAANPNPKWVAPPGTSLHRYATELDLGPPAAYAWLQENHRRFGFIRRYEWEPWHYGYGANPRDRAASCSLRPGLVGAARRRPRPGPPPAAELRPAALPRPDRQGRSALERADERARGSAVRRVGLQPVRPQPGRRGGDSPVHAGHGRRLRASQPVRPGRGDRRPGASDERSAQAVRGQGSPGPRRLQRGRGGGAEATAACRPTPRRAPTWRRSSACSVARATFRSQTCSR